MSILVLAEHNNVDIKSSTLNTIAAASKIDQDIEVLDHLEEIKKRLLEDPRVEKVIAKEIAILGAVSDRVSKKVRDQYEENPYPRWIKPKLFKGKSIAEFCDDTELQLYSEKIKNSYSPPKYLVVSLRYNE